jgi:hypothetical protein
VYGHGNQQRSRRPAVPRPTSSDGRSEEDDDSERSEDENAAMWDKRIMDAEMVRVKGMDRERESTTIILRNAARAAVAAKRQSMQR